MFPGRAWQNKCFFMSIYVVVRMANSLSKHGKSWQKTELGGFSMLAKEICHPHNNINCHNKCSFCHGLPGNICWLSKSFYNLVNLLTKSGNTMKAGLQPTKQQLLATATLSQLLLQYTSRTKILVHLKLGMVISHQNPSGSTLRQALLW